MTLQPSSHAKRCFYRQQALAGALWTLLLLIGISSPTFSAGEKPLTAILLTAQGEVADPYFADSVVLVMNNLAPSPVGIIINRPTQVGILQQFPDLKKLARLHDKVYFGGPVDIESVWFLFRAVKPDEHAIQSLQGVYVSADRALLLRLLAHDKPLDGLRIFLGHAEWAPGQLETETDTGAWTAKRAEADGIFKGEVEHPWPGSDVPKDAI